MTNVLCWPLEEAAERLMTEGFRVETVESKPRKGKPAGCRRVIRQEKEKGVCRLTWSNFNE